MSDADETNRTYTYELRCSVLLPTGDVNETESLMDVDDLMMALHNQARDELDGMDFAQWNVEYVDAHGNVESAGRAR